MSTPIKLIKALRAIVSETMAFPPVRPVKTIILTAPQGWGKTTNAQALRQEFGCNRVVDNWKPMDCTFEGALHLTNTPPHQIPDGWLLHHELIERGWSQNAVQGGAA